MQITSSRGRRSRNKVSVGEPAEGSLTICKLFASTSSGSRGKIRELGLSPFIGALSPLKPKKIGSRLISLHGGIPRFTTGFLPNCVFRLISLHWGIPRCRPGRF